MSELDNQRIHHFVNYCINQTAQKKSNEWTFSLSSQRFSWCPDETKLVAVLGMSQNLNWIIITVKNGLNVIFYLLYYDSE